MQPATKTLDDILSVFDFHSEYRGYHRVKIKELLSEKGISINDYLLDEGLAHLVHDGFLRIDKGEAIINFKTYDHVDYYSLTISGDLAKQSGYDNSPKSLAEKKLVYDLKNAQRVYTTYRSTRIMAILSFIFSAILLFLAIARALDIWPYHK